MEHHKTSKLLKDSTVPNFVARKWIEDNQVVNILSMKI